MLALFIMLRSTTSTTIEKSGMKDEVESDKRAARRDRRARQRFSFCRTHARVSGPSGARVPSVQLSLGSAMVSVTPIYIVHDSNHILSSARTVQAVAKE
jgi:hypothetical protein